MQSDELTEVAERLKEIAEEMGDLTQDEYRETGAELHEISQRLLASQPDDSEADKCSCCDKDACLWVGNAKGKLLGPARITRNKCGTRLRLESIGKTQQQRRGYMSLVNTLAERVVDSLFSVRGGKEGKEGADRIALKQRTETGEERDLGGYCKQAAVGVVAEALAAAFVEELTGKSW